MMKRLRRYLVAGLLVWLPVAITFFLLRFVVGKMDQWLASAIGVLPQAIRADAIELLGWPGLGVIFTFLLLLLTGVLAANFIGRAFVGGWESLMDRIPVVRSIYSAIRNFTELVFSDSSNAFKHVLLIEYPRKGLYSLAFQTSEDLGEVQGRTGEEVVGCFVPTTPNPTSGFIIIVPKKDVTVLDMEVDEALKMIISLGVVVPSWRRDQIGELPLELPLNGDNEESGAND
jgi:uncharacterized membrane protein